MSNTNKIMGITNKECEQKIIFSPHAKNSDELINEFVNALVDATIGSIEKGESK